MIFREVLNLDEAEKLRIVRNQCYEFMTTHNKPISYKEQLTWFNKGMGNSKVFLVYILVESVECLCGYGLIAFDKKEAKLTGCLLNEYRGLGLGKILFSSLIDMIDMNYDISLEVYINNLRAVELYKKLGFIIESVYDSKIYKMNLSRRKK